MGSVFRQKYTATRGGKRVTRESKKWYVEYVDPGTGAKVRKPGYVDRQATERMLSELESHAAQVHAGFLPANHDRAKVPLLDHLKTHIEYLESRNNTAAHIQLVEARCKAILSGCQWARWADISADKLSMFLAGLRKSAPARKAGLSVRTTNHYLTQFRGFVTWLSRQLDAVDPLTLCRPLNAEADRRHVRRALGAEQFACLIGATRRSRQRHFFLKGPDRAALYLAAAFTGFRASELASLTPASFALDADPPTVTVQAGYSKRRRLDTQPIPDVLIRELKDWLVKRKAGQSCWPGGWAEQHHGAAMLRLDLEAAKIPYQDDAGRVFDFHALRGQFITALARAGVPLVESQRLARHSNPTLTSNFYTHLELRDLAASANRLQGLAGGLTENAPEQRALTSADATKRKRGRA